MVLIKKHKNAYGGLGDSLSHLVVFWITCLLELLSREVLQFDILKQLLWRKIELYDHKKESNNHNSLIEIGSKSSYDWGFCLLANSLLARSFSALSLSDCSLSSWSSRKAFEGTAFDRKTLTLYSINDKRGETGSLLANFVPKLFARASAFLRVFLSEGFSAIDRWIVSF